MAPVQSFIRRRQRSLRRFSVRRTKNSAAQTKTEACEDTEADAGIEPEPELQDRDPADSGSPEPVPEQPLEGATDSDVTDAHSEEEPAPFPESTPLLDTTALRAKIDLGRTRSRARAPRSVKLHSDLTEAYDWRTCDSTDEPETRPDSDGEEEPKPKVACPPPVAQRVNLFPGLSPAALIAQLKKRTSDRTAAPQEPEKTEEDDGSEEQTGASSQLSRSPRSAHQMAGAMMVLPPMGSGGAGSSPAWLKELKSKKRMGQQDAES